MQRLIRLVMDSAARHCEAPAAAGIVNVAAAAAGLALTGTDNTALARPRLASMMQMLVAVLGAWPRRTCQEHCAPGSGLYVV